MRRLVMAAVALALLTGAATVPTTPAAPATLQDDIERAARLADGGDVPGGLALLDRRLAAAELPADRARIQALRMLLLNAGGKTAEARAAGEEALAATENPAPPFLNMMIGLRTETGDDAKAAELLIQMADSFPEKLQDVSLVAISQIRFRLRADEQRSFDLNYALVLAKWRPNETVDARDDLLFEVIGGLVKRDRIDEARPLLAQLVDSDYLTVIAVDRRFEKLWPDAEARLGPKSTRSDQAWVALAKAAFDKAPKSLVLRTGYGEALLNDRQAAAAEALLNVATTPAELAALTDDEVWLVDRHARSLIELGRPEAAAARYAAVNSTPVESHPRLINTIINAPMALAEAGRPQLALTAADFAESRSAFANDYGKHFIRMARVCALSDLGRAAEAASIAAPLLAKPSENDGAFLGMLVCLDRRDALAAELIRRLGTTDRTRSETLEILQHFATTLPKSGRNARFRAMMGQMRARPDVNAAFLKAGRDLPVALVDSRP